MFWRFWAVWMRFWVVSRSFRSFNFGQSEQIFDLISIHATLYCLETKQKAICIAQSPRLNKGEEEKNKKKPVVNGNWCKFNASFSSFWQVKNKTYKFWSFTIVRYKLFSTVWNLLQIFYYWKWWCNKHEKKGPTREARNFLFGWCVCVCVSAQFPCVVVLLFVRQCMHLISSDKILKPLESQTKYHEKCT